MSIQNIVNKDLTIKEIISTNYSLKLSEIPTLRIDYTNNVYTVSGSYGNSFHGEILINGNFIKQKDACCSFVMTELFSTKYQTDVLYCLMAPFSNGKIVFNGENEVIFEAYGLESFLIFFQQEKCIAKIKCSY